MLNYKRKKLTITSRRGVERHAVNTCCVVGMAVEQSWKLAYKPQVGTVPIPLHCQAAADLATVHISDVIPEGEHSARRVQLAVPTADATLALKVAKDVVAMLQGQPYNLEVLTADHTGPSSCPTPHDLIMSSRLGGCSCLAQGLHSVEVKCREVISKTAFDWEGTLTLEATPLWKAELRQSAKGWQSRILILVAMPRPCHRGPYSLHASILKKGDTRFRNLWGWAGYRNGSQPMATVAGPKPKLPLAPPALQPTLSDDAKWEAISSRLTKHKTDWVRVVDFLDEVKVSRRHSMRFLDGLHSQCWELGPRRRRPQVKTHYLKMKGAHGGGAGEGIPHARTSFLKQVFLKYYASSWAP